MNSIEYVSTHLEQLIQDGTSKPEIVNWLARACEGWPYVFGAWGEECTPAGRRKRKRDDHPTIVSACQVLNGSSKACSGCKWDLPVRMFDCRGFTYWVLSKVGVNISGGGCTSQWNTKANWMIQGPISEMPKDRICCIFVKKGSLMEHTGFYLGDGSTAECSSGVQIFGKVNKKWTHYAIPANLYDGGDVPVPTPSTDKPTLRKGDSGPYVTLAQTELINRGYDLGSWGADGKYGSATERAVRQFQQDWDLKVDGIIGPVTWGYLDSTPVKVTYTVTVPNLSLKDAEALTALYSGTWMKKEGGDS